MLSAQIADRPLRELATVSAPHAATASAGPGGGSVTSDVTATGTTASVSATDAVTAGVTPPGGWTTVTVG
jgi:hypothetical protein